MREILFKGKRIVNGEWVEGDLAQDRDLKTMYIQGFDYYTGEGGWEREPFCYQIAPETLCQYTGTNDRNGNKIWENDIVQDEKHEEYVGVVQYGKYAKCDCDQHETFVGFYTDWKWESDLLRKDLGFWEDKVKVIGNIFDNPELMEEEK